MIDIVKTIHPISAATIIFGMGLSSCNFSKSTNDGISAAGTESNFVASVNLSSKVDEGLRLTGMNCYSCHDPSSSSPEKIAAPPLAAVKIHYLQKYPKQEAFVKTMVSFVPHPQKEKALMKNAVAKYGLMPAMPIDSSDLAKIADYIYANSLQSPDWFDAAQYRDQLNGENQGE